MAETPKYLSEKIAVILLGAGHPYHGASPSGLHETPDRRLVLDWIIDAYSYFSPTWHFVGGFQVNDVVKKYPELNYSINENWQTTKVVESLFSAPLRKNMSHFVSYTDIVYCKDTINKMSEASGDVVLAIDKSWRKRYEGRAVHDMKIAEKIITSGSKVIELGESVSLEDANAEFAGIAKLSVRAIKEIITLRNSNRHNCLKLGILDFFKILQERGVDIQGVDIKGNWAELNAPQDLARYVLGTKSETLKRLHSRVKKSQIGDQVSFSVEEWQANQDALLKKIERQFDNKLIAIRSSSEDEDSWDSSGAGKFLSLINIPAHNIGKVKKAICQVIDSYKTSSVHNQVLIQKMILSPILSGVVFTRTLRMGAPYYVVNYDDESGKTDTVTSGTGENLKTLIVHRDSSILNEQDNHKFSDLIEAIRELEELVGFDSLDIEFAITNDGVVHILQLRPITIKHDNLEVSDNQIDAQITKAEHQFYESQTPPPQIVGGRSIFGIMPDWNPAEMIGTSPRHLALSLYKYLITDQVWAQQRAEYGYRDVRPQSLMTSFIGHPYIDVRTCFNSFIPASLDETFASNLTNYYIDRLISDPHLHDKVEFDILFTSLTFDFDERKKSLFDSGFSESQVNNLREQLVIVTKNAFQRYSIDYKALEILEDRFNLTNNSSMGHLEKACVLLQDCRKWGTLPFAHLARGAFVATSLLKSGVATGLLSEEEHNNFMRSLVTVAGHLANDSDALIRGHISQEKFLERYGHLRPGTYEITSPCYSEAPENFLRAPEGPQKKSNGLKVAFAWKPETLKKLNEKLSNLGLTVDIGVFDKFLRKTIEGREHAKFVFSKSLSTALNLISEFGKEIGLDKNELSHIPIDEFLKIKDRGTHKSNLRDLRAIAKKGQQAHNLSQAVELPPLIYSAENFRTFHFPKNQPNFISTSKIIASVEDLTNQTETSVDLSNKLLLIPHADPGYDWIFSHKIAGLITKFGGANSHMAIRAAEFGLPAVIGLGELAYNRFRQANIVELNCAERHIRILQ